MNQKQHFLLAIAAGVSIVALGVGFIAWPSHAERLGIEAEMVDLDVKSKDMAGQTERVRALTRRYAEVRSVVEDDLKAIPNDANVADVVRRLGLAVDGINVIDQTFAAGGTTPATPGAGHPEEAIAVTVDMSATFDSLFALVLATERMDRLIRVASVRIVADHRSDKHNAQDMLVGTVGLELIYDPTD